VRNLLAGPAARVLAYSAGARATQLLPAHVVQLIAATAGTAASHVPSMAAERAMVARHQRRVCGPDLAGRELDRQVDRVFASYGRYWAEALRLPGIGFAEIDAGMSWEGVVYIEEAIAAGRGCILALPHLGGWEWAGVWLIQLGFPMTVVVEALEPPELFEWFVTFRKKLGMEVVSVGAGAGSAVLRALKANHVVCLLSDRNIGGSSGVEVEFFGERTLLPGGPATLAIRTGASLLPTAVYFSPDGPNAHHAVVCPPLPATRQGSLRDDVTRLTQALATDLEGLIRREPTQWHLLQPNWPSDGDQSRDGSSEVP
jgi:phosphatidylinositol dimannoside acyltransferase